MIKKDFLKSGKTCKATFSLSKETAVNANQVFLLGEFNDWNIQNPIVMKKQNDGSFTTTLELTTGRNYEFRYLIDNMTWANDRLADAYVPTPFGVLNSVISVTDFQNHLEVEKVAKEPKKATRATATKAVKETSAKAKSKDDLKKIEGIGPKIEKMLNEAGIHTFSDLAKAKNSDIQKVLDAAGPRFKMHDPATWSQQAELAANGKLDMLKSLQAELKGGKKK